MAIQLPENKAYGEMSAVEQRRAEAAYLQAPTPKRREKLVIDHSIPEEVIKAISNHWSEGVHTKEMSLAAAEGKGHNTVSVEGIPKRRL